MRYLSAILVVLTLATLAPAPVQAQWSTESLSAARQGPIAVSVGGKALFAGGFVPGATPLDTVDIYDDASGTWSTATLSVARANMAVTVVGNLALFAGGLLENSPPGTATSNVVDVFDAATMTWSTATLSQARFYLVATTVGSKALFAGGGTFPTGAFPPVPSDVVDIYDASIGAPSNPLAWSTATLSTPRGGLAAATVGSQAVFAGGTDGAGTFLAAVDIYDEASGLWSTAALSQARAMNPEASATVGTRAYFGGGFRSMGTFSDVVDIYDAQTGGWSSALLSTPRSLLAVTSLGNTVLFAGGLDPTFAPSNIVDALNVGTGHWDSTMTLSQARYELAATILGGKALFAGGNDGSMPSVVVDVYEPIGLNYCTAFVNSTGLAATISATGSASLAANNLVLHAVAVPNSPFLFFHGTSQVQAPLGNGLRCTGGGVVRIGPVGFATGGVAQRAIDLPAAGITTIGVRNFQCWFRDAAAGGAGTNTSDAIEITIVP